MHGIGMVEGRPCEGRIPELEQIERHRWTREALLQEVASRDLVFEPGTRYEYSNYGYFLLGTIIERAGDASYADQLADRISDPAGMTLTRGDDNDAIIPGRALGYHFDYLDGPLHAPYLDMSFTFGYWRRWQPEEALGAPRPRSQVRLAGAPARRLQSSVHDAPSELEAARDGRLLARRYSARPAVPHARATAHGGDPHLGGPPVWIVAEFRGGLDHVSLVLDAVAHRSPWSG
jgi:CubicO group peptidase (beta-lactamase class C family)